jgi:hypothetical protein
MQIRLGIYAEKDAEEWDTYQLTESRNKFLSLMHQSLLKVIPLMEINRQIKGKLVTFKFSAALYDFIKLVLFIVFVTNLYACIYFAIDKYYYDQQGDFYQQGFLWLNGSYALGNLDIF